MPFSNLQGSERKVHSQNGEDGVIEAIFARIGTTDRFFVEFGAGDGLECNGAYLIEQGWTGLMIDAGNESRNPRVAIQREFVTAENINALFAKYRVPQEFDLLSIDIDGNDFWVWRAINARPRVVVIEYNAHFGPDERVASVYDPNFSFTATDYFGASLLALQELGKQLGYTLVHCERTGTNAFFIADKTLPPGYQGASIEAIYRPPNYLNQGIRWRPDPTRKMIDPFDAFNEWFSQVDVVPGW